MTSDFPPELFFHRQSDYLSTQVDDEMVMLEEHTGLYFGFNPMATEIWLLLEHPMQFETLLQTLIEQYDVSYTQCKRDLTDFLQTLLAHQLIRLIPPS